MKAEHNTILYALQLTPETRVALCPSAADLRALDWRYVLMRARQERIGPALYRCLRDKGGIPEHVMHTLESLYHSTAYFTARLRADLGEILRAFSADGIETIVLKGGVLGETVYRDPAHRWMCDLDLLVKGKDLASADRRLKRLRWAPTSMPPTPHHHLPAYIRRGSCGAVELHRHVSSVPELFGNDMEGVWRRSRWVRLSGEEARVLCPEDLLLHLGVHACYGETRWIHALALHRAYDVALTVRQYGQELSWRAVMERAETYGVADCLYWALYSAREICGVHVPEGVLEDLNRPCQGLLRRILDIHLGDPVAQADTQAFRIWPYGRSYTNWEEMRRCLWDSVRSAQYPIDMLVLVWGPLCHLARRSRAASLCAALFWRVLAQARTKRVVRACASRLYGMLARTSPA